MRRLNAAVTTKMCHARPGDVIRLASGPDVEQTDPLYMLIVLPHDAATLPVPVTDKVHTDGLYSDPRPLALVNLETGIARKLPHLSSRVEILRDATILYHHPLAT